MNPTFSVIIPCYNASRYIVDALDSVFAQSYGNLEVIVINDGSTDNSLELLHNVEDARLRIVSIPNSGVSAARNKGIGLALGKYVAFLDADDMWHPSHLRFAYEALEKSTSVKWYTSACMFAADVSESWKHCEISPKIRIVDYFTDKIARATSSSSTIIRKDALGRYDFFPENSKLAEDTIAWAIFATISPRIAVNMQPTAFYRQHNLSASHVRQKTLQQDAEIFNSLLIHLYDLRLKYPSNRSLDIYTCKQFSGYFRLLAPRMSYCSYNTRCSFRIFLGYLFCYILCCPIFLQKALLNRRSFSKPSNLHEIQYTRNIISQHFNCNKSIFSFFFRIYVIIFLKCNSLIEVSDS